MTKIQPTSFIKNTSGNLAVTFAILAIPVIGAVGVAVDYMRLSDMRSNLQDSVDAALLAGAQEAQKQLSQGARKRQAVIAGKKVALAFHEVNFSATVTQKNKRRINFQPLIKVENGTVSASATVKGTLDTTLATVIGLKKTDYVIKSEVNLAGQNFVELHFVIDNSNSMGIGASASDQTTMDNSMGCAFACHVPDKPYNGNPAYTYIEHENTLDDARALGVKLRIDVAKESVEKIVNDIENSQYSNLVSVAVHTFSNDITTVQSPTTDFNTLKRELDTVTLSNEWGSGGTTFYHSMKELEWAVGYSGDGTSAQSPKKIVFLMTDGVSTNFQYKIRDLNYVPAPPAPPTPETSSGNIFNFTSGSSSTSSMPTVIVGTGEVQGGTGTANQSDLDPNLRTFNPVIQWGEATSFTNVQGFNPRDCENLKSINKVDLYTLNLEYVIPGPGPSLFHDTRFSSIKNILKPLIPGNMQACASAPEKSLSANSPTEIEDSLKSLVEGALSNQSLVLSK